MAVQLNDQGTFSCQLVDDGYGIDKLRDLIDDVEIPGGFQQENNEFGLFSLQEEKIEGGKYTRIVRHHFLNYNCNSVIIVETQE